MASKYSSCWKFPLLCFFIIVLCAFVSGFHDEAPEESGKIHRIRRSPQLFSGRNVLTDLTQMKPLSLSDLNEFRNKMASLANFTALLEQAVAAEKAARSNLQSFVNTMKEQITGVRQAVNPDPENFWMESKDKCGEVMVSQTGKISYRLNNYYQNHERCVWTVRANYRSKIKVAFNSGGLEEDYDYIAVTALIHKNEAFETEWVTKRIQPGQTNIFEGPLIFISFVSDGSIQKEGFQLEYEGMGTNINTKTIYQHYHFTDWTGQFDSANLSESLQQNNVNLEDGMSLKVTAVINPNVWSTQKLQVSIPESRLDLRPDECTTTNLAILNDFAIKSHGTSNSCCAGTCEVSSFETANRMMVGIFTSSDVSDGSQFEINWSSDSSNAEVTSSDTCGGILVGDYGKIEYKVEKIYENNERCLWAMKPGTSGAIEVKLQLLKDGFEFKYDYVSLFHTISNDNGSSSMETIFLYKSGDPLRIPSSLLFLEFYSDSATFGQATGFELIWEFIFTERTAVPTDVGYTTEGSGNEQLSCSTKDKLHFYIISPPYLDGSPVILGTGSDEAASSGNVSVFGSLRGSVSKLDKSTNGDYESDDGIIIVMTDCRLDGNNNLNVPLNWRKGDKPQTDETSGVGVFAKSEDQCGEILLGDSGRISYKLGKEYELNERCTWITKAKSKTTITVQLTADGFESCCDGIQINRVDMASGTIESEGTSISREHRFHTFEGGVLLVMFYSDHSVKGTGFTLEFQTKGDKIDDNLLRVIHWYVPVPKLPTSEEPFGPMFVQCEENSLSINAFILPQETQEVSNSSVAVRLENLKINECDQDSVSLLDSPIKAEYNTLKRYPHEGVCPLGDQPGSSVEPVIHGEENYVVKGLLIVVMKIKEGGADKSLSVTFT